MWCSRHIFPDNLPQPQRVTRRDAVTSLHPCGDLSSAAYRHGGPLDGPPGVDLGLTSALLTQLDDDEPPVVETGTRFDAVPPACQAVASGRPVGSPQGRSPEAPSVHPRQQSESGAKTGTDRAHASPRSPSSQHSAASKDGPGRQGGRILAYGRSRSDHPKTRSALRFSARGAHSIGGRVDRWSGWQDLNPIAGSAEIAVRRGNRVLARLSRDGIRGRTGIKGTRWRSFWRRSGAR